MERDEELVYLTTVVGTIQGHLVVGRLRSEGVNAVMDGPGDGPYPFPTEVDVLVPVTQYALAQEVLLADEVDNAFEELDAPARAGRRVAHAARLRRLRRRAGS